MNDNNVFNIINNIRSILFIFGSAYIFIILILKVETYSTYYSNTNNNSFKL